MGDDHGCNNIQKHREQTVLQNYLRDEDKGVEEETKFFSVITKNSNWEILTKNFTYF